MFLSISIPTVRCINFLKLLLHFISFLEYIDRSPSSSASPKSTAGSSTNPQGPGIPPPKKKCLLTGSGGIEEAVLLSLEERRWRHQRQWERDKVVVKDEEYYYALQLAATLCRLTLAKCTCETKNKTIISRNLIP